MPTEIQKDTYKNIMNYYDLAENLISVFEDSGDKTIPYIDNAEKLVSEIERNTEILVDNFLRYVGSGKSLSGVEKLKMERAKEKIQIALDEFIKCFDN